MHTRKCVVLFPALQNEICQRLQGFHEAVRFCDTIL